MTFDPKYGYARIGNKTFTLGGQAAPAPRDSNGGDENAAARRTRDRDYLFSRFGCLFSGLSLAYVGGGPLSLGMLFYLWRTSQWLAECPECGSTALIYFVGGSPLSGMNRWAGQSAPREEKPREDFRAISRRWRRDYDEKSEAELERAARERGERREAERLRALENERKSCEALGLTPGALPTETAEAMLKKLENHKEETT